jgi:hypothetical protein
MISILRGLRMLDGIPRGDLAIYVFLEMIALGFVLDAADVFMRGGPWWKWVGATVIGLILFVGGLKWRPILTTVVFWKAKPNVTFDDSKISIQKVVADGGRLRLFVPNEKATFMFAATVEVRNHAIDGKRTASAGQVKAQLRFMFTQGTYDVAPGMWLDEPYSSVNLDTGDTRRLILAVGENWSEDWRMVTNKRSGPTDAAMLDYSRGFPLLAKGTLEVSIVGSGRVLRKLKASVSWKRDENLMLVPMEEG